MRRELSILYSRFYGSLLFGLIILYRLQKYMRVFVFALYSFWVPQIFLSIFEDHRYVPRNGHIRNALVQRSNQNHHQLDRRPLHPLYIVGMSATRLAIPLYFLCCPRNFLHVRPQYVSDPVSFVLGFVSLESARSRRIVLTCMVGWNGNRRPGIG